MPDQKERVFEVTIEPNRNYKITASKLFFGDSVIHLRNSEDYIVATFPIEKVIMIARQDVLEEE